MSDNGAAFIAGLIFGALITFVSGAIFGEWIPMPRHTLYRFEQSGKVYMVDVDSAATDSLHDWRKK